jgi:hypothetical protein
LTNKARRTIVVVATVLASLVTTGVAWAAAGAGGTPPGTGVTVPIDGLPLSGSNTPKGATPACSPDEDPAVGCGLRLVGHNDILGRGNNFNLAAVGTCAYVSSSGPTEPFAPLPPAFAGSSEGIAVLDVRDPGNPQLVSLLRTQGGVDSGETIATVDAGDRKVLVVGSYGGRATVGALNPVMGPALDVYDVSDDCTHPVHMATVYWPDNAHNLTLNAAGTRVYGTRYAFEPKATVATAANALGGLGPVLTATGLPLTDVMVMDIRDLAHPKLAAQLRLVLPDGAPTECHKVELDESEQRLYCASDKLSSRAQPDGREPPYTVWPTAGPTIWDISEVARGVPNPVARFVGESAVKGQGGHHAVPMTIVDGTGRPHRYVIAANELAFTCDMAAYPRIWDIDDETHPVVVGELHLPAPDGCSGAHYNDVDDRNHATMALVGWTDAGFRVFDIRDPAHPRPLAYLRPGSGCYSVARMDAARGYIWFACKGGFYVADLSPATRASMDLPPRPAAAPGQPTANLALSLAGVVPSSVGQSVIGLACWLPAVT